MADPALVDSIANQIAGIESGGGNYAALGPTTDKGDRAYGKYQIMGSNIPSWTQEAIGKSMTPEAFLADQDAQERTAKHRMGVYLDEYGRPEDVASMWHSGLPYDKAVAAGRKDQLGTTTESYGARVREGVGATEPALAPSPAFVDAEPDPARLSAFFADANVPQEVKDQVGKAMRAKVGGAPTAPATSVTPPESVTSTTTTSEPTTPTSFRDTSVDDAGRAFNVAAGRDPEAATGKYGAAIAKPIADALDDVAAAFTQVNPESTGNPLELSTWRDALDRSLKILHPLGVAGEAAGNVIMQIATDAGAPPEIAAGLAFAGSLYGGAKTPGISGKPGIVGRALGMEERAVPAMPLQRTPAPSAAVAEAEAIGSPTAVKEALTPDAMAPAAASRSATQGLETALEDIRQPVKGIYNTAVENAQTQGRTIDPIIYNESQLPQQLAAIKEELGPTLTGQPKKVIDAVESNVARGEPIDVATMDAYKQQLDTLFQGRAPMSATPKQRLLYDFKWKVRDMLRSTFDEGDREWAEAADTLYRDEIIGKSNPRAIGRIVKLAQKDPETFAKRALGNGASEEQGAMAEAVMKHLKSAPEKADAVRQSVFSRWIDDATDTVSGEFDRAALLDRVGKTDKRFYKSLVTPEQDAFFKNLRRAHDTATEGGKLATSAQPGKVAWMTAKGLEIAAIEGLAAAGVPRVVSHTLGAGALLIPRDRIATAIADSKTANLLARALVTGAKSPAAVTLVEALRNRNKSINFLGGETE